MHLRYGINLIVIFTGQAYKREENKGKGRKWGNVDDMSSRFFTMDYAHIKRRRPVHNMSRQRP